MHPQKSINTSILSLTFVVSSYSTSSSMLKADMAGEFQQDQTSWTIRRRKVGGSDIRIDYAKHTNIA